MCSLSPAYFSYITPSTLFALYMYVRHLRCAPPCRLPLHHRIHSSLSPISEMNERTGQRRSNSTSLTNGLSWQLHLLAIEKRQGCSHTLAADLYSRSLFMQWQTSLRPCQPQDELLCSKQPIWEVNLTARNRTKSIGAAELVRAMQKQMFESLIFASELCAIDPPEVLLIRAVLTGRGESYRC